MKKLTKITVLEISETGLEDLTVKGQKALIEAKVVLFQMGTPLEIMRLANKKSEKVPFTEYNNLLSDVLNTKNRTNQEILIITLDNSYPTEVLAGITENLIIIPTIKPYLSLMGGNKISITKRGTNTGFLVIKEKVTANALIKHLKFIGNTTSSIVIQNNFEHIGEIIHFFKKEKKEKMPIALISGHRSNPEWSLGTIEDMDIPVSFYSEVPIILIGESIRQITGAEKKQIMLSF